MKKTLKILRRKAPEEDPYYQSFPYETQDKGATVATALMEISTASDLAWEHSCLQKKCGACAMIVDGKPVLACDTRLSDCPGETVIIEPLRKFPVIRDLLVDRSAVTDKLRALKAYPLEVTDQEWERSPRQTARAGKKDETAYEASRCIQCGLCLEVCPNYYREGNFGGMAAMAPLSRLMAKDEREELRDSYRKYVYEGCGKSLACRDVCPAGIDMDRLLSRNAGEILFGKWFRRKDQEKSSGGQ